MQSLFELGTDPNQIQLIHKKLRIPYMGSKQEISTLLLKQMLAKKPKAKYFYDLFGGGGAMSLCALVNNFKVHYNEINTCVRELLEHLVQVDKMEDRFLDWVSRDDFNRLKHERGYYPEFVRIVYSFGNRGTSYAYKPELEELKRRTHEAVVHNRIEDIAYFAERLESQAVMDLHQEFKHLDWVQRRALWVELVIKAASIHLTGLSKVKPHYKTMPLHSLLNLKNKHIVADIKEHIPNVKYTAYQDNHGLEELKQLQPEEQNMPHLSALVSLEALVRMTHIYSIATMDPALSKRIGFSSLSYDQVEITTPPEETILYCDPPYLSTATYRGINRFNHEAFFKWASESPYSVFVSEYCDIPDLTLIYEKDKIVKMAADSNANKSTERLYWNGK